MSATDASSPPATAPAWQREMDIIVDTVREMSRQTDPQGMVRVYGSRMRQLRANDGMVALSRRELDPPRFRVTRSSLWKEELNPWTHRDRLPVLQGGLLGELLYGDLPRILNDYDLAEGDPAKPYLEGFRSLAAIPVYDGGTALNMTVLLRRDPRGFDPEQFPDIVLKSNLFGRATQNLVLMSQLREAHAKADHEAAMIADIQRSLLPGRMPEVPNLDLAVYYQTSRVAGGDYYDLFPLAGGRWGLLVADVSGHGTPAAVLMAITHSLVHVQGKTLASPADMLNFVNRRLVDRYTQKGRFVTAFYGVYDPADRTLTYSSAGHHPPLWKRAADGVRASIDGSRGFPLGLMPDEVYTQRVQRLEPGDVVLVYTDGITEAFNPEGQMFGLGGVDAAFADARGDAGVVMGAVLDSLHAFARGRPPEDDQTLVAARVK